MSLSGGDHLIRILSDIGSVQVLIQNDREPVTLLPQKVKLPVIVSPGINMCVDLMRASRSSTYVFRVASLASTYYLLIVYNGPVGVASHFAIVSEISFFTCAKVSNMLV